MGEIADDCYDRALDELMDFDRDPYEREDGPEWYSPRRPRRPQRPRPSTTRDDFDALP